METWLQWQTLYVNVILHVNLYSRTNTKLNFFQWYIHIAEKTWIEEKTLSFDMWFRIGTSSWTIQCIPAQNIPQLMCLLRHPHFVSENINFPRFIELYEKGYILFSYTLDSEHIQYRGQRRLFYYWHWACHIALS